VIGDVDFNDASRELDRAVVACWAVSGAPRLGRHISGEVNRDSDRNGSSSIASASPREISPK
jgi:hypothetical protein